MNPCVVATPVEDTEGDDRWIYIVSDFAEIPTKFRNHSGLPTSSPKFILINTSLRSFQHKRYIAELREKDPDVIFLGDCVLESLAFTDMWKESFAPLHCLNLSIREDKVENLLYRVQNGILENVKPKVIMRLLSH